LNSPEIHKLLVGQKLGPSDVKDLAYTSIETHLLLRCDDVGMTLLVSDPYKNTEFTLPSKIRSQVFLDKCLSRQFRHFHRCCQGIKIYRLDYRVIQHYWLIVGAHHACIYLVFYKFISRFAANLVFV
jgi:hypothetical protein